MSLFRIKPVILAGGIGTRLWPLSRESRPKQFLPVETQGTMLQVTLGRLEGLITERPLVICNEGHRFLVAEQMRQSGLLDQNILLEPCGRNTAPAVAMAALRCADQGSDPCLLVLAADHSILDAGAFKAAVLRAQVHAEAGRLVTFGIAPTSAETGYGYIHRGSPVDAATDGTLTPKGSIEHVTYHVAAFVEKPDANMAEQYLRSGEYFWNSGMFLFRATRYLEELERYRPDIVAACRRALASTQVDADFIRVDEGAFAACPSESIDYAVMEKTRSAVVTPLNAGWSDVGAFESLWQLLGKDADGNAVRGDVLMHDSHNNLLFSETGLVAAVGLTDTVVVQTRDAVLVAPRNRAQDVKQIVAALKAAGRSEHRLHREEYRPWGKFDSIDTGPRYKVKRITVNPGAKLSLQMHHHRAEHWVVVTGTARVTIDGVERFVTENESTYVPIGAVHSLENPGKLPLELIEVQVGGYLGEDDIVRLEDRYGRV